ncbi:MAG: xanthine dehydrogenase family protein molybdopterin-binding subunit, partial [Desulfopila sp.]
HEKAQGNAEVTLGERGNVLSEETYERGDVDKGFAEAEVVLEETYRTSCELQTPLELHGCVANWDRDRLTIWESSQGVYAVQSKIAECLKLPLSKVRVVGHYMGGGFGSKLTPGKYTVLCALLARKTARPVKLFLTREETYLCVGNRPPNTSTDLLINAGPARPFRAPGHPQGAWALEQMIDALAKEIDMDPIELRLKNIPLKSQAREGSPPYTTTGLRRCLEDGAKEFDWQGSLDRTRTFNNQNQHIKRGVGMGACLWIVGDGGPPSTVII